MMVASLLLRVKSEGNTHTGFVGAAFTQEGSCSVTFDMMDGEECKQEADWSVELLT